MALVGLAMVFGMPYLLENSMFSFFPPTLPAYLFFYPRPFISGSLRKPSFGKGEYKADAFGDETVDPEMKAEFEEQQKKSVVGNVAGGGNPLSGFDMAGWMAGQTAGGGVTASGREIEEEKGSGGGQGQGQGKSKGRRRG